MTTVLVHLGALNLFFWQTLPAKHFIIFKAISSVVSVHRDTWTQKAKRKADLKALVFSLRVASCSCFSAIMSSSCWAYAVGGKVEIGTSFKVQTHRPGRSRPRWSWRAGRRPAGSSAPSSPPGSCATPLRPLPIPTKNGQKNKTTICKDCVQMKRKYKRSKPVDEQHSLGSCTSLRYIPHRWGSFGGKVLSRHILS